MHRKIFFVLNVKGNFTEAKQEQQPLKALVFLYAFEESVDCHLLSSFCDDSNLHISLLKYVLSTMGISKFNFSPVSFACNFQEWGCVILREIDFLLKICWGRSAWHTAGGPDPVRESFTYPPGQSFLNCRNCHCSSTFKKWLSFQYFFYTITKCLYRNEIDFCDPRQINVDHLVLRAFWVVQACPR